MNMNIASIVVLVIGIGLLLASLCADQIGLGADPGFGRQQTAGTIVGVIITGVGAYLTIQAKKSS